MDVTDRRNPQQRRYQRSGVARRLEEHDVRLPLLCEHQRVVDHEIGPGGEHPEHPGDLLPLLRRPVPGAGAGRRGIRHRAVPESAHQLGPQLGVVHVGPGRDERVARVQDGSLQRGLARDHDVVAL